MKKLKSLILLVTLMSVMPATAFAYTAVPDCTQTTAAACQPTASQDPIAGPNGEIIKIVHLIAFIAGVAAIIVMVIGGLKYVLSDGDPQNIKSARETIFYAAIGLVVIVLGQTIIAYVLSKL